PFATGCGDCYPDPKGSNMLQWRFVSMAELTITSRFQLENRQLPEAVLTAPILTMAAHASVRHYKPDPVAPEALEAILTAARSASTSSNLQMYSIIVVTDQRRRQELAALTGQEHV